MPPPLDPSLKALCTHASEVAQRAHVPYSQRPTGAALLLSDGTWVPGVRVESASFSLTIPALLNAYTTAVASGRSDVIGAALSRPLRPEERVMMNAISAGPFRPLGSQVMASFEVAAYPRPQDGFDPFLPDAFPADEREGISLARKVAHRAHVPESGFPVGCVLVTEPGILLPGVNVEHDDWTRILCAERNVLGTAVSYGFTALQALYLSCLNDPAGTPCGACRQLLVELSPEAVLWMDRGAEPPEQARPQDMLPGAFRGHTLLPDA